MLTSMKYSLHQFACSERKADHLISPRHGLFQVHMSTTASMPSLYLLARFALVFSDSMVFEPYNLFSLWNFSLDIVYFLHRQVETQRICMLIKNGIAITFDDETYWPPVSDKHDTTIEWTLCVVHFISFLSSLILVLALVVLENRSTNFWAPLAISSLLRLSNFEVFLY